MITNKITSEDMKQEIKKTNRGSCSTIQESIEILLNELIPSNEKDIIQFHMVKEEIQNKKEERTEILITEDEIGDKKEQNSRTRPN